MGRVLLLIGLVGCNGGEDTGDLRTCEGIEADFEAEADRIRSCSAAEACGQVLTGTSCGCTREWVARLDADTSTFEALLAEGADQECGLIGDSPCDCPEADGFDCVEGTCTWNYTDSNEYLPACSSDEGDPFTVESASIEGDTLTLSVLVSGGCEEHSYTLCWPDQSFLESYPVQAGLELLHDDHDDPCDSIYDEAVELDLAPLKQAWQDSYQQTSGTILVGIGGFQLSYSF